MIVFLRLTLELTRRPRAASNFSAREDDESRAIGRSGRNDLLGGTLPEKPAWEREAKQQESIKRSREFILNPA